MSILEKADEYKEHATQKEEYKYNSPLCSGLENTVLIRVEFLTFSFSFSLLIQV